MLQVRMTRFNMIQQASRSSHNNIWPCLEAADLWTWVHTSNHKRGAYTKGSCDFVQGFFHLNGELACRQQNQTGVAGFFDVLKHGEGKRECFSGPCLRDPNHVRSRVYLRDSLILDGGWVQEVERAQALKESIVDTETLEGLVCLFNS